MNLNFTTDNIGFNCIGFILNCLGKDFFIVLIQGKTDSILSHAKRNNPSREFTILGIDKGLIGCIIHPF